jgi:hypothetical protein
MSDVKNKPITKSLGPFFSGKWSRTIRKQVFKLFWVILRPFGQPKIDLKRYTKAQKWAGLMAQKNV